MVSRKLAGWGAVAIVLSRFINQYLTVFVIKHYMVAPGPYFPH